MVQTLQEIEALAVRNAELEQLLLQRTFELEVLSELSHQVKYPLCDKDLLSLLINSLDRVLPIDVAAGLITSSNHIHLVVDAARPLSDMASQEIHERLISGFNLMTGCLPTEFAISAYRHEPSVEHPILQNLDSIVLVPMLVGMAGQPDHAETVGMLLIGATAKDAFTQNHLRFLYTVANQGAVSLSGLRAHLYAEKKRLAQVTTHFSEGVILVNREGHILFSNPRAEILLDQLAEISPDQRLSQFAHKPLSQWLQNSEDEAHWQELPCLEANQPPLELMVKPSTLSVSSECFTLIIRENSTKQNLETLKNELIATISHELRTPLTLIYAPLEMISSGLMGSLTEEGLQLLSIATKSANQLKSLIDSVLELSQLEAGLIQMQFEPCNAVVLAEQAISRMTHIAAESEITIQPIVLQSERAHPLASQPYVCCADPEYIQRVLKNLLENAIKFSTPGSQVSIAVVEQADSILISVQDQGMGILEDQLVRIFARFQQGDGSRCRAHDGLGMGLAICDRIIQLHDGEIWAESVDHQGSTFHFTLPKATPLS